MQNAPLPRNAHWPPAYIYFQTFVIAVLVWLYSYHFYNDDAYISLRYARNLLDGNGLTWNPGERLEGYTNFLFILLAAGLGKLGMELTFASQLIGFTGFFALLILIAHYLRRHIPSPSYPQSVARALCLSLIASSVPLLAWCIGGLEGNLYTFFLCAAVCSVLKLLENRASSYDAPLAGLCFALAALTRPDGAIFTVLTLGFLGLLWMLPATRTRLRLKDIVLIGATFGAIFVPYFFWRIAYFGDWLPNTYYAKSYGIDRHILLVLGGAYVFTVLVTPPFLGLFAAIISVSTLRLKQFTLPMAYLIGFTVAYLAYLIDVGGDYMPYARFALPLIPILALLIYYGSLQMIPFREKTFRDICAVLLAMSIFQFFTLDTDRAKSIGALSSLVVKDYIGEHWKPGSLIAINPVGALPYFDPQYRYLDMLGLLDRHIAQRKITMAELRPEGHSWPGHLKGDGAYVLSRKPDYIIFGHAWGIDEPMFLSDVEISESPEFKRHYDKVEIYVTPPDALLPQLKVIQQENEKFYKLTGSPKVKGFVMNDRDQVRFIYFKRKN